MLSDCRTERPASHDDEVERAPTCGFPGINLREIVAEIAALNVFGERRRFRSDWHCPSPGAILGLASVLRHGFLQPPNELVHTLLFFQCRTETADDRARGVIVRRLRRALDE